MASETTIILRQCLERMQAGDATARDELIGRACERLRRLAHAVLPDGGETFGLGLALVTQKADRTQRLTLRSQLRSPRQSVSRLGRTVRRDSFLVFGVGEGYRRMLTSALSEN